MNPLLRLATQAARSAGDIILRAQDRLDTLHPTEKGHNDFVTVIDQRAERKIIEIIRKAYPDHTLVCEESGRQTGTASWTWVIDPLDGTHNYLRGLPHFSVSIGILYQDTQEHALVYDPVRQECFTATRGSGAHKNNRRIRVNQTAQLHKALISTGFPVRTPDALPPYIAQFSQLLPQIANIRTLGSAALDLCYVAAGRLDGFFEVGLKHWDTAAGSLIVQEAGGLVCDFTGGKNYLEQGIIAATPRLLDKLCEQLKQL